MSGRRVESIADIERPGDYALVHGFTADRPAVFFLLPNSRDDDAPAGQRSLHHVTMPPHVFRECPDGSIEIRESIGAMPFWHGYLDEGHVWRSHVDAPP